MIDSLVPSSGDEMSSAVKFSKLSVAFVTAIGALAISAPAASATQTSSSCVGSLIASKSLVDNGVTLGYLKLYWDGSTGQNCAMTTSSSYDNGVAKTMQVELDECFYDNAAYSCSAIDTKQDGRYNYQYFAGPVSVPGTGHCVMAIGEVVMNNGYGDQESLGPGYC